MKFGCLYYANSENVGDDIQTYAQWKFLPKVDYWIDRESLHLFCPDEEYKVALIMNAWFMYSAQNWPPSPYISPLFISTHFSKYHTQWLTSPKKEYAFALDYLREHAPIGCRDASTMQILQQFEIETYFSGCLTLTLSPFADVKKQDYICLVDVSQEIVEYIKRGGDDVRVISHNNINLRQMTPEERMAQAEEYLRMYQAARCVLTSRLHCALPCTGLKTPVMVLYSSEYDERFNGLKGFFYIAKEEEFLQGKWDSFLECPCCHSDDYVPYAGRLADACRSFVADARKKKEQVQISYEYYRKASALQATIQKETYIAENYRLSKGLVEARKLVDELQKMNSELRDWSNDLQNALQLKDKEISALQTMNEELRTWSADLLEENTRLRK